MRLAVVTPRYGPAISGGAETAARLLAEQLVARLAWDVEVLTTTAIDTDWNDGFAAGTESIAGVRVRRFGVERGRAPDFGARSARLLPAPRRATTTDENEWLLAQGPVSTQLVDAVGDSDADVIALHPYLYHPTVAGAARAGRPVLLHGAAHDEPALALAMYRDLYQRVDGLAFWSEVERDLVLRRFHIAATPHAVIGLGVEAGTGSESAARDAVGLGDRPYLLCLGRVDDGKGAQLLARLFAAVADRRGDDLHLVFAGAVVDRPPPHPRIVVTGPVDEPTKWGLLRGAVALVSPSVMESFGIVLTEAWSVGRPVLVHAGCAVTARHTTAARGGLAFGDLAGFDLAVERLVADRALGTALGRAGREHTERHFAWDAVVRRYARLCAAVQEHAPARR